MNQQKMSKIEGFRAPAGREPVEYKEWSIWIFLFDCFDLSSPKLTPEPEPSWRFWDMNPGNQVLARFRFSLFSRPIYKNIFAHKCTRPIRSVFLDFCLPWPAKCAVATPSSGKWWPFKIMLNLNYSHRKKSYDSHIYWASASSKLWHWSSQHHWTKKWSKVLIFYQKAFKTLP